MRHLTVLTLLCGALGAHAAQTCRVLDPELQGQYEGGCDISGLANGAGTAGSDIAIYRGEFHLGKKHGRGSKQWLKTGDRYEGEFDDDFRHGWGIYRWGSNSQWAGQEYTGQFNRDKLEGIGTYLWPNGNKFTGEWRANLRYGESYMESRANQSLRQIKKSISIGTTICKNVRIGIISHKLVVATVIHQHEESVDVLYLDIPANYDVSDRQTPKTLEPTELVTWSPCDLSTK